MNSETSDLGNLTRTANGLHDGSLPPGVTGTRFRGAGILVGLFLLSVGGPWLWFRSGSTQAADRMAFVLHNSIPNWQFEPEPVAPLAQAILGTTNLTNGRFVAADGQAVMAFTARWQSSSSRSMSVVQHTPDVCWVGGGWRPVDLGQPRQVILNLGGSPVPFECRAFVGPNQTHKELVVWCTLVGGRVLPESGRWKASDGDESRHEKAVAAYRRIALDHFVGNIRDRRLGSGDKQFVRFSVTLRGDWKAAMEQLEQFSRMWIEVTRENRVG